MNQTLQSVEGRVNSQQKMAELESLRDQVYRNREDNFHWDMSDCVEVSCSTLFQDDLPEMTMSSHERINLLCSSSPAVTSNDYTYDIDSFVAVHNIDETEFFWIAKIMSVRRHKSTPKEVTHELHVYWIKPVSMNICLLYTSPSPRDQRGSRMPSSA